MTAADRAGAAGQYLTFRDIWAFLRRHMVLIGVVSIAGLGFGVVYMLKTPPSYTAIARLVIDPEQARITSQDAYTGTIIIEAAEVASKVEIVKSEAIALSVIRQLKLTEDPEIFENTSWRASLRKLVTGVMSIFEPESEEADTNTTIDEEDLMRRAMAGFLSRVSVRRVGQSYVLEIGYTSNDGAKAARTANAIANAYIKTGMNAKSEAARSGADWLEGRLIEVGRQAKKAALAVEEFRGRNNIPQIGATSSLEQQQVSEINSQLLAAKANTAAEAAKLSTINRLVSGGLPDGYVDDALKSTSIYKLRDDALAATTRLNILKSRYGEDGAAVQAAEREIAAFQQEIRNELLRIQSVYKANVETAKTRERLLEQDFNMIVASGSEKNMARVELAELESRASTYRRMYESVLQQLMSTLQKESFPVGDARIVTAATTPFTKTWPKSSIVMPFSLALGMIFGLLAAGTRELTDRRIGEGGRLGRELGLQSLGHVPRVNLLPHQGPQMLQPVGKLPVANTAMPETRLLRRVLDSPYSHFAEALRGIKNAIDSAFLSNDVKVIGVTSVASGEGKTTIATNLAQLYLNEGVPTVLVDANFQDAHLSNLATRSSHELNLTLTPVPPSLQEASTRRLRHPQYHGERGGIETAEIQAETIKGQPALASALPDCALLPLVTVGQIRNAADPHHKYGHLPALKTTLEGLRRQYKVVIVDLAAFEGSADAQSAASYTDAVLLVLGNPKKMTLDRLSDALVGYGKARVSILGAILNRSGDASSTRRRGWSIRRLWHNRSMRPGKQKRSASR
ncbi:GumC family protein [Borborobacter arsenicus]|nr:exopolysaccharide transport family protein [Pseudaminobacter arsenicus]